MKTKIAVRILGHKAPDLDLSAILKWRSTVWEIFEKKIDTLPLNGESDLDDWGYSDAALVPMIESIKGADFTVYILNVPLQDNYYCRRISRNVGCISLFEVAEILREHSIPLENFVLRMLYTSAMIFLRKRSLLSMAELSSLAHHETKGCIFDMTGIKGDIVFSCNNPILCQECRVDAGRDRLTVECVESFSKDLSKIRKPLYYRIIDLISRCPIGALVLSAFFAVILGAIGSLLASYLCEKMKLIEIWRG